MAAGVGLLWDLVARDNASPAFLRVAGAADKAATATGRAQAKVAAAGAKMSAVGSMMSRRLTLPLLAIGAASVKAATDFNSSMTRIQTQAGASAKDVKTLSAQVLAMKGAQQGPNQLASALYHLKSVGLDNVGAMKALRQASNLAAVGNADLEETTNALAGAWRTGIKGATDFHQAAATVNAVIGAGNMKLGDLNEALSTGILPSAKTFGLTFKDVGSALALFTDESVPANVAATRLRMSFSLLGAPSAKAESELNKIGVTGLRLADDMRKPNGLITAIGDLKSHLEDPQYKLSLSEQAQLLSHAFGGGRSSSAILSLINNFDVLKQKQDQVTASMGKYDHAVKVQQATPQAQFHEAVANLEKAGVLLGNQLIPAAIGLAHVITSIASGFNGLNSGATKFAAEVGIGLLVLGPMLSIVGKIGKAIVLMWAAGRGALTFAAGMRGVALAEGQVASKAYLAGSALRGISKAGAAFVGVGIGYEMGKMAEGASKASKAMAVLGGAATGAMAGFLVGGPIGAAIGGLTGLLGSLAGAFGGGSGAARAAAEMNANVSALTGTLTRDGTVVGTVTRQWVAHDLATSGVLDHLDALGISYRTATQAALGNKAAIAQVNAVMAKNRNGFDDAQLLVQVYGGKLLNLAKALDSSRTAAQRQYAAEHQLSNARREGARAASRNADALGNLAAGSHDVAAATTTASGVMHGATTTAAAYNKYIRGLTKSFLGLVSAELGMAQSQDQVAEAIRSVTGQLKGTHDQLDLTSKAGLANRDSFLGAASAALSFHDAQRQAGVGVGEANRTLIANVQALRSAAVAAGANKSAVNALLKSLHLLPRQIRTEIHLDGGGATLQQLRDIQNQINSMHGKTLFVGVQGGHTLGLASGGGLPNGVSAVGERGPELAIKRGKHVEILSNSQSKSFLNATGMRAPGFAGGTGGPITTTQSGGKKVWVYNGIQYASLMAAKNAETRDQQSKTNTYRLSGAPGVGGTTYSSRKAADNALAKAIKSLDKIFGHMSRHDLPNLRKALGKTGSDVRGAVSAFLQDAKQLGVSLATRRSIAAQGRDIASNVNARNRAQARLSTLLQNRSALKHSVGDAGRSGFDITNAGTNATNAGVSFGAFRAQELQYSKIVHKWASGIRKLSHLGFGKSPTGRAMLAQFAQADPTVALPRIMALLSASPKQLAGIIATEKDIGKTSSSLGGFLGQQKYGDKISHQRDEIQLADRIISQAFDRLEKRLEKIENREIHVDLTVDGRVLATATAKGAKRNGRRN